jgi:hypothetical protein
VDWQPIETVPKDGTTILLHQAGVICTAKWISEINEWWETVSPTKKELRSEMSGYWDADDIYDPDHWMPLPAPPK